MMNNNNFGHSAYAHQGPGYQINAAGGTVNNTVYHGENANNGMACSFSTNKIE